MIENLIKATTCCITCGTQSGTGHLVTPAIVLTARHCIIQAIEQSAPIQLVFPGGEGKLILEATILAHTEQFDACLLSIAEPLNQQPIPLSNTYPREGSEWVSFGYPWSKKAIGHRVSGTVSNVLDFPRLKINIDLAIDRSTELQAYDGLSGAAVVSDGACKAILRVKMDNSLGAISIRHLAEFLLQNGVPIKVHSDSEGSEEEDIDCLADRSTFQADFENHVKQNSGQYIFLEGAHGIGKTTYCNFYRPINSEILNLGAYSVLPLGKGLGAIYHAQASIFFDWISTQISGLLFERPSRIKECSYSTMVVETSRLLDQFASYCKSRNQQGILFIDGLNEVNEIDSSLLSKLLGLLPLKLPDNLTVILTAPNYGLLAAALAGRVKSRNAKVLPPLSNQASVDFCSSQLQKEKVTVVLISEICEKAQGNPLYLRYLIEYVNSKAEHITVAAFPVLSGPIEDYYDTMWARLLQDQQAIHVLAIVARLRWGIPIQDLLVILKPEEQALFVPTVNRISHLLSNPDNTAIYHSSFAAFIVSKTKDLEAIVHDRLAGFCLEFTSEYCQFNLVFHLLRSGEDGRRRAVLTCQQSWIDACVPRGIEPDALLSDIEATVEVALTVGPTVDVVRLLLLSQRVNFRYNALFAQSSELIAKALIALGRPREALKHAIRFNTLLVSPEEILQIAISLIQHEYKEEAHHLLSLLHRKILGAYSETDMDLDQFCRLCHLHIWTLFFKRLTLGWGRMEPVLQVIEFADSIFHLNLKDNRQLHQECTIRLGSISTSYFVCFRHVYISLAQMREISSDEIPFDYLLQLAWSFLACAETAERFNLPKAEVPFAPLQSDMAEMIRSGATLPKTLAYSVLEVTIRLAGPLQLARSLALQSDPVTPASRVLIKAKNGVDIDFENLVSEANTWRIAAFLDESLSCPVVGPLCDNEWHSFLEQLTKALFYSEGRARRALSEANEALRMETIEVVNGIVLQSLNFTLAQRVKWHDSYFIPEQIVPFLYQCLTILFVDCFPEELPRYLQDVIEKGEGQFGVYTEGYRMAAFEVVSELAKVKFPLEVVEKALKLLRQWRDHVIRGVENRHELVPEILKLIPLFVKVGATEEAERLYVHLLGVSMGPSWYKEDQFGLMTSVLASMPQVENAAFRFVLIAAYLERASGEMTFQRYVRYEKASLIGAMFRQKMFAQACAYFKQQSCGSILNLIGEWEQGSIDKPSPREGMRYPGGAIDEQDAILRMVRGAPEVDWRLRWSLLEIFLCGDSRHFHDYALEFVKVVNEFGHEPSALAAMSKRISLIICSEIALSERRKFSEVFRRYLNEAFAAAFPIVIVWAPGGSPLEGRTRQSESEERPKENSIQRDDDDFYLPGTFGRRSAMESAERALEVAESQLNLGNVRRAQTEAVNVLQVLQQGGWNIWGGLSASSSRAEAILKQGAATSMELIQLYAPLVKAELYTAKWRLAKHLIVKLEDIVRQEEGERILDCVIKHVQLMVGDASKEILKFEFLGACDPASSPDSEVFAFIVWLIDHPKGIRRDRAASIVNWLMGTSPEYVKLGARRAFTMSEGSSADVLCGSLDGISLRDPLLVWNGIFTSVDIDETLQSCKHVCRLAVLQRIAERAGNHGSKSGSEVAPRIARVLRNGAVLLGGWSAATSLPIELQCIEREWAILEKGGWASQELLKMFSAKMCELCSPLSIGDAKLLEEAVLSSFSEPAERALDRWEGKVRFALNCVLFSYSSALNLQQIESILRIWNPSQPEQFIHSDWKSPEWPPLNALFKGADLTPLIGDSDCVNLNYQEIRWYGPERMPVHVEIVAVMLPSTSFKRAFFAPSINSSFRPTEVPVAGLVSSHETCCRFVFDVAYFGSFTPAIPLNSFTMLLGACESDFIRRSWRDGRLNNLDKCGLPVREGCLLGLKRGALNMPSGRKLAWLLLVNGKVARMVDSQNNPLL